MLYFEYSPNDLIEDCSDSDSEPIFVHNCFQNVLLDDKKGRTFCVGCDESGMPDRNVDHEKSLDNNVARASSSLERPTTAEVSKHSPLIGFVDELNEARITQEAKNVILESMKNATAKLNSSQNATECAEYANLIRSCADALCSLNKLKKTFLE